MSGAKELCALLVTRRINELDDDQEELVVDYLYEKGYNAKIDESQMNICRETLQISMKEEMGGIVPITAYANNILSKHENKLEENSQLSKSRDVELNRRMAEDDLENQADNFPSCNENKDNLISEKAFVLKLQQDFGYTSAQDSLDGLEHFEAIISVSTNLYNKIFLKLDTPIVKIKTTQGNIAYARIAGPHEDMEDKIYISRLVSDILKLDRYTSSIFLGKILLCDSLPDINFVDFTYYGSKNEMNEDLPFLFQTLPNIISGYSYLSLGMVLKVKIDDRNVRVRVERLHTFNVDPANISDSRDLKLISAGVVPFGQTEMPFTIDPDL